MKLEFLDRLSKNTQMPNFMKIRPVGAQLCHADGRTDRQTDRRDKTNNHFFPILRARLKKRAWGLRNISSENHKVRDHFRDVGVTGTITLKIYLGEIWCEGAVWTQLRSVPKYATTASFDIIFIHY